jgi:hypothetical protein
MKRYTAKVSFEFAFECSDEANPKTEATELIQHVGETISESDWKRDTLKIKIFDLDVYQPKDYEEGEYVLYTKYVKEEDNE